VKKIKYTIIFIFLIAVESFSSQEGVLSFSKISFESEGIGTSGPVSVLCKNNKNEIHYLEVNAFGKKYILSQRDLKKISKLPYNGIQLSYEQGYKELGGKTVYIVLVFGFKSGTKEKIAITVVENGTIEINSTK
jgi:hypothetical protein